MCDGFPRVNILMWKTDTPALQVPETILIQTLEKGTEGLIKRRREEYLLWEHSKSKGLFESRECVVIWRYFFSFRHGRRSSFIAGHRLRLFQTESSGIVSLQHVSASRIHV